MTTGTRGRIGLALGLLTLVLSASAADPAPADVAKRKELIQKLEKQLTGSKFVGRFTVVGKDEKPPAKEEYTVSSAVKLDEGDNWLLNTRIKYGDKDVQFPVPIEILWAGETPVITLNETTIPGLGTFGARVVIHDNKYAGTWQHDKVGGHLYGTIERAKEEK